MYIEKKEITVTETNSHIFLSDEKLVDLVKDFTEYIQTYGPDTTIDYCEDYGGGIMFFLRYKREETDEEYIQRIEKEQRDNEQQKIRDLSLLKELKNKYPGS